MNTNNTNYKRTSRQMPQYVKDKISAKMTGRKLSQETKNKISMGQKNAWAKIPHIQPEEQTFGYIDTSNNNSTNTTDLWQ
ncbi:MAG: hypothetical protein II670_11965 [Alphaproteobacteria bacterium]|nr:hypothetical protein [Alphaproteobacteria bacterium]